MSQPGWYPDPGGQTGMFRYWDGRAWSASTTNNPQSAPPPGALGQPSASGSSASGQYGASQYGTTTYAPTTQPKTKGKATWWIVAIVLALVVILAAVFGIRALLGRGGIIDPSGPGGSSTREVCPTSSAPVESSSAPPSDGRVHGGKISYPQLGTPWSGPATGEDRVPFARNVVDQKVSVEPAYDGPGTDWVASVLVADLVAGDGFFTPQEGSEIVVKCIVGSFYGPNNVNRDDKKNEAMKVSGKDAWLVESHLTFDIPNLKTKGELLLVVIVATSPESSSLYYASIPDTVPELVQPARDAMKNLKVDG